MQQPLSIMFDCERMKYPHTGIYHFCLQLGSALIELSDKQKEVIDFYIPPSAAGVFGNNVRYREQKSIHKFRMPSYAADVWHCTFQGSMYFPFRRKKPVVLTVHDLNYMHEKTISLNQQKKYLKIFNQKAERADHLIFISRFTLNDARQYINLDNKACSVIYNASGLSGKEQPETPKQLPRKKFIYTIGTITDKKNFHVIPCLLADNDLQLVISGIVLSETYKKKIIAEAVKYNAAERLIFTGGISENDKIWYLKNCEAFIFPSLAEGFGKPVTEAMQYGKPIFLSNLTSLPEIGGDVCFYFKNFDAVHMQEIFNAGLDLYNTSETLRTKIINRGAGFNWLNTARQYLRVYHEVAGV